MGKIGTRMKEPKNNQSEPAWLDPRNDRKTPFSDAELERFTDDFIARMGDVKAWQNLIEDVGELKARENLKARIAAQDEKSLINWDPTGPFN